ncbi:MAG: hypothetical protein IH945_03060 [Armatimonadetes bacterium]|nr:hypothetical protein [Armatimonadota bacterium]
MQARALILSATACLTLLPGCGGGAAGPVTYAQTTILLTDRIADAKFRTTWGGVAVPINSSVTVDVTTASTLASHTGTNAVAAADLAAYLAAATNVAGLFAVNGAVIEVRENDSWGEVVNDINTALPDTGVRAEGVHDGTFGSIRLWQTQYGSNSRIELADSAGIIQVAASSVSVSGVDAIASVTVGSFPAHTFTGGKHDSDGLTMTDIEGNMVQLTVFGSAVGTYAAAVIIH